MNVYTWGIIIVDDAPWGTDLAKWYESENEARQAALQLAAECPGKEVYVILRMAKVTCPVGDPRWEDTR